MDFVYPQYLWLLAGVPALMLLWGIGVWHHSRMRARFGNLTNLREISRVSWGGRGWLRGGLFAGSLAGMVLGLAYPQMLGREMRAVLAATDVVFILDTSPSMFATDMDPNRLGRAEQIVQQFILRKPPDDRFALVGFNYTSLVLSYLTRDPQSFLVYFDYLNRTTDPGIGTNMGSAIVSALRVLEADEEITPQNRQRRRVFVLMSDGDDNVEQWEQPLSTVAGRRIKLYTFGLGSATGASIPLRLSPRGEVLQYATAFTGERIISKAQANTLRTVAERTGARFFRGEDERQVQAAVEEILTTGRPVDGYQAYPIRRDLHLYFFTAAFICMLAGTFL